MIHYTYRIDNLINGKYYIGKHSSESLDDDYMGSGPLIKAAIAKYGIDNFKKTILKTFPTSEEAFEHEAQIVTMAEVNDPMCYNIQLGGKGRQKQFTGEEAHERALERQREYYQRNKELISERRREYKRAYLQRPEVKEHRREYMKGYHQQPEVKELQKEYMREYLKEYRQRPGFKELQKEYMKEYCQRPGFKEYRKEYNQRNKERISEYQKVYQEEYRRKKREQKKKK